MGGPLRPCIYLAPLWRYEASNVARMHARTDGWMNERSGDLILCPMLLHCIEQTINILTDVSLIGHRPKDVFCIHDE